jgi:hypothetical protein
MKPTKRIFLRSAVITAACAFLVFFLWIVVIADNANGPPWWSFIDRIPYGDKVAHLCLISAMSFLCNLAFPTAKPKWFPAFLTLTSLVILVLLSLEERSQAFVPSRHLDFFDWLADLAGLVVGQFVASWFRTRLRKSVEPLRS